MFLPINATVGGGAVEKTISIFSFFTIFFPSLTAKYFHPIFASGIKTLNLTHLEILSR